MRKIVTLTDRDLAIVRLVAYQRDRAGNSARADNAKHGNERDSLRVHYEGCLFEAACAKGLNVWWSGASVGFHDDDDVGGYLVRGTLHAHGSLLVRPTEIAKHGPGKQWICVRGNNPFEISGWLYNAECADEKFLRAPNGRPAAYFIPADYLRGLETL